MPILIEETLLRPDVTGADIDQLVANTKASESFGICVPPFWVKRAQREVGTSLINIASVAGYPYGYQMTESKCDELIRAIKNGAHEIDVAMNLSSFKSGMPWTKIEFARCTKLAHEHEVPVKFILDTTYLNQSEIIEVTQLATDAGGDYIALGFESEPSDGSIDIIRSVKDQLNTNVGLKITAPLLSEDMINELNSIGVDRIGRVH